MGKDIDSFWTACVPCCPWQGYAPIASPGIRPECWSYLWPSAWQQWQCNASCLRTRLPSVSKPSTKMQTHPPFKLLQIHHSLIIYDSYDHIRSVYICVLALPSNVLMHLMSSVSCIHLYACRSAWASCKHPELDCAKRLPAVLKAMTSKTRNPGLHFSAFTFRPHTPRVGSSARRSCWLLIKKTYKCI